MRSVSLLLALASAGVIAHPSLHRHHIHHNKREQTAPPKLFKAWDSEGIHHEEYIVYDTVVLPAGEQAPEVADPAPSPVAAPVAAPAAPKEEPQAPAPQTPKVETKPQIPSVPKTPEPVSNAGCAIASVSGGDAASWANDPCSGGKSILDSFNKMRASWIPSLASSPYTWDAKLAANARLTAASPVVKGPSGQDLNEGGATAMNHNLFDGSNAQCIASGDSTSMSGSLTPFETAAKMWLCELPQGDIGCSGGPSTDTGHAEIIKSSSYTKVGCYYMDATGPASWKGEWTCDFA